MSEIATEGKARDLAHIYPAQEFAIADITKIYGTESDVAAQGVGADAVRAAG